MNRAIVSYSAVRPTVIHIFDIYIGLAVKYS